MGGVRALRRRGPGGALPGTGGSGRRGGLVRARFRRAGRGAAAAPDHLRASGQRLARRPRRRRSGRDRGTLYDRWSGGHAQPSRRVHLPAFGPRERGTVCAGDTVRSRAAGLSSAGFRRRPRHAPRVLRCGSPRGHLRRWYSAGLGTRPDRARLSVSDRTRSDRHRTGDRLSAERRRDRVSVVVLLVEQRARRRAARARRARRARRPSGARTADTAHAGRSAVKGARR